jgi:hypothetical protein
VKVTLKQAAKAFERLMNEFYARNEAGWAGDMMFDGGEFSGSAISSIQEEYEDKTLRLVSQKTGYTEGQIYAQYRNNELHQFVCQCERLNPRTRTAQTINSI